MLLWMVGHNRKDTAFATILLRLTTREAGIPTSVEAAGQHVAEMVVSAQLSPSMRIDPSSVFCSIPSSNHLTLGDFLACPLYWIGNSSSVVPLLATTWAIRCMTILLLLCGGFNTTSLPRQLTVRGRLVDSAVIDREGVRLAVDRVLVVNTIEAGVVASPERASGPSAKHLDLTLVVTARNG